MSAAGVHSTKFDLTLNPLSAIMSPVHAIVASQIASSHKKPSMTVPEVSLTRSRSTRAYNTTNTPHA